MNVTVTPMRAKVIATGRPVTLKQKHVRVDGRVVGYVFPSQPDKVFLFAAVDDARAVQKAVAEQLGQHSQCIVRPDVPPEMTATSEEPATDADFD